MSTSGALRRPVGACSFAAFVNRFLLICFGGALGTGARFLVTTWAVQRAGTGFPAGTVLVNVTGSFLLALVMELALAGRVGPELRLFLGVGVMGGYTTYSSFNFETLRLSGESFGLAVLNVAVTLVGCLAAGALGAASGRLMVRPR